MPPQSPTIPLFFEKAIIIFERQEPTVPAKPNALYHLVRDRLELAPVDIIIDPNDISKQLADFQTRAVENALKNIENYGGAFVSDVVGLGKSYIGAAIVKRMEQKERARTLIICPPPLIEM